MEQEEKMEENPHSPQRLQRFRAPPMAEEVSCIGRFTQKQGINIRDAPERNPQSE
jgi:hypothetical protein